MEIKIFVVLLNLHELRDCAINVGIGMSYILLSCLGFTLDATHPSIIVIRNVTGFRGLCSSLKQF